MSRHRDVRNLDYDEEYDEAYDDAVYGHSVDDHEYGVSPSTEEYLYSQRGDVNYGFGAYFPGTEKIQEEEEDEFASVPARRDSSSYERPRLSSEDEVKLNSVLDELRNVVGDQFSEAELVKSVLDHRYDFEMALNAILNKRTSSNSASSVSVPFPTPSKQQSNSKKKKGHLAISKQSDDCNTDSTFSLCPYEYMPPLSYTFSSAFIFEKGVYERIPIRQLVKEWYSNLPRTQTNKEQKVNLKLKQGDPLIEESKCLASGSKIFSSNVDYLVSNVQGYKSYGLSKVITSNSSQMQVSSSEEDSKDTTDSEAAKSDLLDLTSVKDNDSFLPDKFECSSNDGLVHQLENMNVADDFSKSEAECKSDKSGDETCSSLETPEAESSPITYRLKEEKIKLSDHSFNFSLPLFSQVNKSNKVGSLNGHSNVSLSSLASANLNSCSASVPISSDKNSLSFNSVLSHSPLDKQSNLSALASAHFEKKNVNKSDFIPSLPTFTSSTEKQNYNFFGSHLMSNAPPNSGNSKSNDLKISPLSENICYSFKNNSSNLINNEKRVTSIYLSSSEENMEVDDEENSLQTENFPLNIMKFKIPPLITSCKDNENLERSSVNESSDTFFKNLSPNKSCNEEIESFESSLEESLGTDKELEADENLIIDLNIALLKKSNLPLPDFESKLNGKSGDCQKEYLQKFPLEVIPPITSEERNCLTTPSLFGKTLFKKKRKRTDFIYSKRILVSYKPFLFDTLSPDDMIRINFEKKKNKV